jgi:hypothetical protein
MVFINTDTAYRTMDTCRSVSRSRSVSKGDNAPTRDLPHPQFNWVTQLGKMQKAIEIARSLPDVLDIYFPRA